MTELTCKNCDKSIRVPESILAKISLCLPRSGEGELWLNYLCPVCKHLQLSSVPLAILQSSEQDQTELLAGKSVFLLWLECVQRCSSSPIGVIRLVNDGTYYDRVYDDMNEWTDSGARCPQGHPPTKPLERSRTKKPSNFL